jgi:hypothetical protein
MLLDDQDRKAGGWTGQEGWRVDRTEMLFDGQDRELEGGQCRKAGG